jgi:hypothetical protein
MTVMDLFIIINVVKGDFMTTNTVSPVMAAIYYFKLISILLSEFYQHPPLGCLYV